MMRWQILLVALATAACADDDEPDAYGNMEATEVVVGAEISGQLDWFSPEEGAQLAAGTVVGVIDTTSTTLEIEQIGAQQSSVSSRANEVLQQIDVLRVQREIAQRAL